jgi:hypothetical protein
MIGELLLLLLLVLMMLSMAHAQGACSAGCVWSCDTRTNTCASPIGKKVCIGVTGAFFSR